MTNGRRSAARPSIGGSAEDEPALFHDPHILSHKLYDLDVMREVQAGQDPGDNHNRRKLGPLGFWGRLPE